MRGNCYLDVQLKLKDDSAVLTPAYFQGSIENSLKSIFGEIGGQTDLELIEFDSFEKRGILKISSDFYARLRVALTLIGYFQEIPCYFKVRNFSKQPLAI